MTNPDISELFLLGDNLVQSRSVFHLRHVGHDDAAHMHERNTREHVAHFIATDPRFTSRESASVAGDTVVMITTKAVVMTLDDYDRRIRKAYEAGLRARSFCGPWSPQN